MSKSCERNRKYSGSNKYLNSYLSEVTRNLYFQTLNRICPVILLKEKV